MSLNQHPHYELAAAAIRLLTDPETSRLGLAELASRLDVSEFHLQRVFTDWAGVSPKRFAQFLTRTRALERLRAADDVLNASLEAGLSSPGRLHDLLVACDGVTPGAVRALGEQLVIRHGLAITPFGTAMVGTTSRGLCHLRFVGTDETSALAKLQSEWPRATLLEDSAAAAAALAPMRGLRRPLRLWLKGTNFQIKVWEALLRVPEGALIAYSELAVAAGRPAAIRAVASAVAANPVAWLVPCHRVIRASGALGEYRWGPVRKAAMIGWEDAQRDLQAAQAA
jgi:AraC family transcriptional regulator of adaptative response/methylated-DNA-[protein]-cysteine methyltransferase